MSINPVDKIKNYSAEVSKKILVHSQSHKVDYDDSEIQHSSLKKNHDLI